MQTVKGLAASLAKSAILFQRKGLKARRVMNAYASKDYEGMVALCGTIPMEQFTQQVINENGMTLLHQCVSDDNLEAVEMLAAKLPYFKEIVNDASNEKQWSPLLLSAQNSNKSDLQVLQVLIDHGAQVLQPAADGFTALHFAAWSNDVHLLDFLIEKLGENSARLVNVGNEEGWTPLHIACFENNMDAVNLLIEKGADLEKRHNDKLTPIHETIRCDHVDLLSCLYKDHIKDAKRDVKSGGEWGPIHLAAGQEGTECLKYLLLQGEFANQICNMNDQATPLHFATLFANYDNCRLLMRHSANPNIKDSHGNTPMHFAVQSENLKIVRLLDQHSGNAMAKNKDGVSAIDLAITEDLREIKLHFMAQSKYRTVSFN